MVSVHHPEALVLGSEGQQRLGTTQVASRTEVCLHNVGRCCASMLLPTGTNTAGPTRRNNNIPSISPKGREPPSLVSLGHTAEQQRACTRCGRLGSGGKDPPSKVATRG